MIKYKFPNFHPFNYQYFTRKERLNMKSTILIIAILCFAMTSYCQTGFAGNTRSGYGGTVGQGTLVLHDLNDSIHIKLIRGVGTLNDAVVIYLNTQSGGYNTTVNFTDQDDGLRKAISGLDGTDRATLTMPETFMADFAVAFDQGFGGLWELQENKEHTYITSANLTPTNNPSASEYNLVVARKDIGLTSPSNGLQFLVTYVSESGFRSNEFIGDAGPENNPQNTTYAATSVLSFGGPLPLSFVDIAAQVLNNRVKINWKIVDEGNGGTYLIERSINGRDFESLGSFNSNKKITYSFEDPNPINGNNFYRILFTEKDGKKIYSKTINTTIASRDAIKAYVAHGKIITKLDLNQAGTYQVAVVNAYGQAIIKDELKYDGTRNNFDIDLNQQLSQGIYSVMVRGNGVSLSCQVLVK